MACLACYCSGLIVPTPFSPPSDPSLPQSVETDMQGVRRLEGELEAAKAKAFQVRPLARLEMRLSC